MSKHDPFEGFIFQDTPLSVEERNSLDLHFSRCEHCRLLHAGWLAAKKEIHSAPVVTPADGFSQRWRDGLAERRARTQQKQIRRFFKYIVSINLFSFLGLLMTIVIGTTPLDIFSGLLRTGMMLLVYGKQIQNLLMVTFHSMPLVLPVVMWILVSTGFCLAVFIWGGTMYRYVIKGAPIK